MIFRIFRSLGFSGEIMRSTAGRCKKRTKGRSSNWMELESQLEGSTNWMDWRANCPVCTRAECLVSQANKTFKQAKKKCQNKLAHIINHFVPK